MSEDMIYNDMNGYDPNPKSGRTGFAITALVMGILSLLLCCCYGLGVVFAVIGLIFGIISLATKRGGKGMAITGVILSVITVVAVSIVVAVAMPHVKAIVRFSGEADKVIEQYNETGELPDYLEVYRGEEYDEFWESSGYKSFDGFFEYVVENSGLGKIDRKNSDSSSAEVSSVVNVDLSTVYCIAW